MADDVEVGGPIGSDAQGGVSENQNAAMKQALELESEHIADGNDGTGQHPDAQALNKANEDEHLRSNDAVDANQQSDGTAEQAAAAEQAKLTAAQRLERRTRSRESKTDKFHDSLNASRRRVEYGNIHWKTPSGATGRFELETRSAIIGSKRSSDIVVDDTAVAPQHAKLRRLETGYYEVVVLGTASKIRVKEGGISQMLILPGDRFVLGETVFALKV